MAAEPNPMDHASPGGKLSSAMSDFALSFVKQELLQLARERDDILGRTYVPKLRALLREVDQEREAFESDKERLVRGLREKLELLQVDVGIIDHVVSQLHPMTPKYLSVIPSASILTIRPPTPVITSPSRDNNYFSTVLGADTRSSRPSPVTPQQNQLSPDLGTIRHRSPKTELHSSPRAAPYVDRPVQPQITAQSPIVTPIATPNPKRPRTGGKTSHGHSSPKRQRTDGRKASQETVRPEIARKIAFPNLETTECIFRHSDRKGYFVIRCNRPDCKSGFFSEPPLVYNRAIKHFQKHGETGPNGEELTNDYIFDNFACQIDGYDMASKYWIKEHLGSSPHTFTPGRTPRTKPSHIDIQTILHKQEELEKLDKDFVPAIKARESTSSRESDDDEPQPEKTRRPARNVPRPDYAELVANKDPWNTSDADSERTSLTGKVSRASSVSKRKSTKPNGTASPATSNTVTPISSTSKAHATEPVKPFGYTEQWPRRSAPR
ncbi:hypothetical protein F4810DRAFT_497383 [Camillea tinctor]|nr:hypothetical protein F4810DRAFT_497383 [Camillea tinctor]